MASLSELISIDCNGNLYIGNYWVYINKNDELDFMKLDKLTFDKPDKINKVINQQLKATMIDKEIDKIMNDEDGDNFIDEEDQNNAEFYINNPETKYVNYVDFECDLNDESDSYYLITGDYKLAINEYNFTNANYEVYFVDIKNNSTIFYTQIINDNPFYRITVNSDNTIKLNLIGTKIKTFKLTYDTDNIKSELINSEFVF